MTENVPAKGNGSTNPAAAKARLIGKMLADRVPIMASVLPRHLTAERLARIATHDIARTPALLKCSQESLVACVLQAAQLGLEPGIAGHAYLVPYGDKCTLILGYRGLVQLARNSGQVSTVQAFVIHAKDTWSYRLGLDPNIEHVPADDEDPGPMVAVYAVARLKDGSIQWEIMRRREVDAIRKRSKASSSGPWVSDYEEMAKKTVLRRLCKLLPMSIESQAAVARDGIADGEPDSAMTLAALDAIASGETDPGVILEAAAVEAEAGKTAPAAEAAKAAASKARRSPTKPADGPVVVASGTESILQLCAKAGVNTGTLTYLAIREAYLPDSDTASFRDLKPEGEAWARELLARPDAKDHIERLAADHDAADTQVERES